jgi:hypothetical protein
MVGGGGGFSLPHCIIARINIGFPHIFFVPCVNAVQWLRGGREERRGVARGRKKGETKEKREGDGEGEGGGGREGGKETRKKVGTCYFI